MNTIDDAIQHYKNQVGRETDRHVRALARWTEIFDTEHLLDLDPDLLRRIIAGSKILQEGLFRINFEELNGNLPIRPIDLREEPRFQKCLLIRICDFKCEKEPCILRIAPPKEKDKNWDFSVFVNPDPTFYKAEDLRGRVKGILGGEEKDFRLAYHFSLPSSSARPDDIDLAEPVHKKRRLGIQGKADDLREIGRSATVSEFHRTLNDLYQFISRGLYESTMRQIALTYGQFSPIFEEEGDHPRIKSMEAPIILERWRGELYLALRTTRIDAIQTVAYTVIQVSPETITKDLPGSDSVLHVRVTRCRVQGNAECCFVNDQDYTPYVVWPVIAELVLKGKLTPGVRRAGGQADEISIDREILLKW